jgi:hypothetical protein
MKHITNIYKCKYCGKKMSTYDYETYHGFCGKCREIQDWKKLLKEVKDLKK